MKKFFWDDPCLYQSCVDGLIHRCVPQIEMLNILEASHSLPVDGNHIGIRTTHKIWQCRYFLPTIRHDAPDFAKSCDRCQRDGGNSQRQEFPLNPILVIKIFDVWGIDFMGSFVSSHGMKYILVAVDYVSKWVEAIVLTQQ